METSTSLKSAWDTPGGACHRERANPVRQRRDEWAQRCMQRRSEGGSGLTAAPASKLLTASFHSFLMALICSAISVLAMDICNHRRGRKGRTGMGGREISLVFGGKTKNMF